MSHPLYEYDYSDNYEDDEGYVYRIVTLKRKNGQPFAGRAFMLGAQYMDKILPESVWRGELGIQQSAGWEHCMFWKSEPGLFVFRKHKSKISSS